MLARIFDNRYFRIVIGTAFGLPLSAMAIVGSIYGLILGFGGIQRGDFVLLGIGLVTVLGIFGLAGAWRRLLKTHVKMTERERMITRRFLISGVISSVSLAIWSYTPEGSLEFPLLFVLLALGGVVFVAATPNAL